MKKGLIILLSFALLLLVVGHIIKPTWEARGKSQAMPLAIEMTQSQQVAQEVALSDPEVQELTAGHRSEVFGVRRVVAGQYPAAAAACATAVCQQVEIYNWDENTAVTVLVNSKTKDVLAVFRQPGLHPGINKRLADLALEIATTAPEVIEALGYQPAQADMAPVDADMPGTVCDGRHLCVAPTFNMEEQILWAAVDLTDERLAGITFTSGDSSGQAELHTPDGCPAPGSIDQAGWTMDYATTSTDGLSVTNIEYNNVPVAARIKLIEWHVDYGPTGFRDSTGCGNGGGGFPIPTYGETEVIDLLDADKNVIGFEVVQDFRMSLWGTRCNYRYEQHLQFHQGGKFRVVGGAYGRGCGEISTYRPVTRIDIAVNGDPGDSFSRWDGTSWEQLTVENYLTPYQEAGHGPHEIDPNGYSWRVDDTLSGQGYYIVQDVGQFDGVFGRGATPFLYVTTHKPEEGDTDLPVIGPCCNDDHQQGPEQFVNSEDIGAENIVVWYVSQSETIVDDPDYYCWTVAGEPNPETYPCFTGPLFVPTAGMDIPPVSGFTHNGPVEAGDTAVFSNTTIGTAPFTYEWDFGDGSPIATTINPTHTYPITNSYTVVLTATNSIGYSVFQDSILVGELTYHYLPAILKED